MNSGTSSLQGGAGVRSGEEGGMERRGGREDAPCVARDLARVLRGRHEGDARDARECRADDVAELRGRAGSVRGRPGWSGRGTGRRTRQKSLIHSGVRSRPSTSDSVRRASSLSRSGTTMSRRSSSTNSISAGVATCHSTLTSLTSYTLPHDSCERLRKSAGASARRNVSSSRRREEEEGEEWTHLGRSTRRR